jgi:glycerophosphoryl diester phosphodiesterase
MTTYKLGTEIIYLSLKLIDLKRCKDNPPPINFYELIEETKNDLEYEQI